MLFHLHKSTWERDRATFSFLFGLFSMGSIDSALTRLYWKKKNSSSLFFLNILASCDLLCCYGGSKTRHGWFNSSLLLSHFTSSCLGLTPVTGHTQFFASSFSACSSPPSLFPTFFFFFSTLVSRRWGLEWQGPISSLFISMTAYGRTAGFGLAH